MRTNLLLLKLRLFLLQTLGFLDFTKTLRFLLLLCSDLGKLSYSKHAKEVSKSSDAVSTGYH